MNEDWAFPSPLVLGYSAANMDYRFWKILALAFGIAGCAHNPGTFYQEGFRHTDLPYRIHAGEQGGAALLAPDWRLENYYVGPSRRLVPKKGEEIEHKFDTDGDGEVDQRLTSQRFDIKLDHLKKDQTIWLRSLPISQTDAHKELKVLLRDYVERVSMSDVMLITFGHEGRDVSVAAPLGRKVGTLRFTEAFNMDGRDMLAATVDVVDLDKSRVDPDVERRRHQLLFVRTNFYIPVSRQQARVHLFPVIMVIGYSSMTDDFAEGLVDYGKFVDAIELGAPPRDPRVRRPAARTWDAGFPGRRLSLPQGFIQRLTQALGTPEELPPGTVPQVELQNADPSI